MAFSPKKLLQYYELSLHLYFSINAVHGDTQSYSIKIACILHNFCIRALFSVIIDFYFLILSAEPDSLMQYIKQDNMGRHQPIVAINL